MSTKWTYSGDPSSSPRDAVRFQIGDTVPGDQIFTDAEIEHLVAQEGSINEASIAAARAAAAKYARVITSAVGDERKDLATRLEQFTKLAKQLELQRGKRVTGIYAGGISKSDKCTNASDTDRDGPAFSSKMHDAPGTLNSNSGEDF